MLNEICSIKDRQQGSIRQSSLRHFPERAAPELEDAGLIANKSAALPTLFSGPTPADTPPTLNPEQASAVETIGTIIEASCCE